MDTPTPTIKKSLFTLCGITFAIPSLFFAYYTLLLIYKYASASADDAAAHRSGGMLIGAVAFPLAAVIFEAISWFCFKKRQRGVTVK